MHTIPMTPCIGLSQTKKIEKSEVLNVSTLPPIPVFRPTLSEFNDFERCMSRIEELGAHHIGLCKVVPPAGWVARPSDYDDIDDIMVEKPICQRTYGSHGIFWQDIKATRSLTFKEFKALANSARYCPPAYRDFNHLEKKYWSSVSTGRPLYGANVNGTLMKDAGAWDLSNLDSILSRVLNSDNVVIPGVNTPYLYYGMWRSTFPWHVEDVELYSVNYLHYGEPKHWYVIPPAYARKFEAFVFEYFRSDFLNCHCFLRHKCVLISPSVLARAGIPTRKIVQNKGEFIITFPYSYHAGFNMGLNIAEAVNFALPRWIDFGKKALLCSCWDDTVRISMEPFVRLYQPDLYPFWLRGRDPTPHPLTDYPTFDVDGDLPQLLSQRHIKACGSSSSPACSNDTLHRRPSSFQIGDLDAIDLRFSSYLLARCRIPWHLEQYSEFSPLWCGYPPDIKVERFYNKMIGSYAPHCAVCSVLWAPEYLATVISSPLPALVNRESSVPHISEVAYSSTRNSEICEVKIPPDARESTILRCANCELCVHATCYGLSIQFSPSDVWLCDACHAPKRPSCILCYVRGGAMKALGNPRNEFTGRPYWAHIVCALANPACRFINVSERLAAVSQRAIHYAEIMASRFQELVNLDREEPCSKKIITATSNGSLPSSMPDLTAAEQCADSKEGTVDLGQSPAVSTTVGTLWNSPGLTCSVCALPTRGFLPLARCWYPMCPTRYHVTCAQLAGVLITSDSYPRLFCLACDAHPTGYRHETFDSIPIKPGDEVMIRRASNPPAFISGVAVRRVSPLYCRISFSDGTFSRDTPPEYLVNIDWLKDGLPPKGTSVRVLWSDNVEYTGIFQGTTAEKWEVRTSEGKLMKISRDQFYPRQPEKKKVLKRTSQEAGLGTFQDQGSSPASDLVKFTTASLPIDDRTV